MKGGGYWNEGWGIGKGGGYWNGVLLLYRETYVQHFQTW